VVLHVRAHRHAVIRVYIHTFGCKANQYDSEVLRQALEAAGAVVVDDPAAADSAIVNSCTVTHVSEAKMRGFIRRISRKNPSLASLMVVGCSATLDDGAIASIQGVTSVIAGIDPGPVLQALGLPSRGADQILRDFRRGSRAWLKIQDGCDEHCTYCATRFARGRSRSRSPEEILEEAQVLAGTHAELVLTGVHIGCYGQDLTGRPTLSRLVIDLITKIPNIRFRLSSVEATQLDETLMDLMVSAPDRLAPHVHAPLQSGSQRILKLMGRVWYTPDEYRERLERLAARKQFLGLGADIIVGFPGETDADFAATRSLVEGLPFTYIHVFPYSPRPVTPAAKLGNAVRPEVTKQRSAELRTMVAAKKAAIVAARDGSLADVVLLRRSHGRLEGLTEDYLTVFSSSDTVLPARYDAVLRYRDGTLHAKPKID